MKRVILILGAMIGVIGGAAALGIVLGFGGWVHPAGDSIALLRPVLAVVCFVALIFVRWRTFRFVMFVSVALALITVTPVFLRQDADANLRIYAKNLWWANSQYTEIAADILEADVDVVMLQEVSERNEDILDILRATFPHQHRCDYSRWSDLVVMSRSSFAGEPKCTQSRAVALAPISVDGVTVWAGSIHIPWPYPYESANNEADAETLLQSVAGPIVLAGDFNIFPWTARVSRIAQASRTKLTGPTRSTLTLHHLPLPIDHVLSPGGGKVERRPLMGSDHRGLVAEVAF